MVRAPYINMKHGAAMFFTKNLAIIWVLSWPEFGNLAGQFKNLLKSAWLEGKLSQDPTLSHDDPIQ